MKGISNKLFVTQNSIVVIWAEVENKAIIFL